MKSKREPTVSLADIAEEAGVSKVAVSFALRNKPGVSVRTRERVLKIARNLQYAPDPRISSWLSESREVREKDLLPIAWINNHCTEGDAWTRHKYLSPYLEGARERCAQHGYRIEEIWRHQPDVSARRLQEIIYRRGIEGAVITPNTRRIKLNWNHVTGVSLEGPLLVPGLPRVMSDRLFNLQLAIKVVRRLGYRRIGVCLEDVVNEQTDRALAGAIYFHNLSIPSSERIAPLFHSWGTSPQVAAGTRQILDWWRKEKPEVVIGHSNLLVEWAEMAGFRVPDDVGIVHLATDDDVQDWAGICSNKRVIGAAAIDLLISRIRKRQFEIPKVAPCTLIRGYWQPGKTLINRKAGV